MSNPTEPTEVIEIRISEADLVTYALLAHEQDITLNQWFINAVMQRIEGDSDVSTNQDE
jgi:predicted HicB family RNase H-like nuclease